MLHEYLHDDAAKLFILFTPTSFIPILFSPKGMEIQIQNQRLYFSLFHDERQRWKCQLKTEYFLNGLLIAASSIYESYY